MAQDLCGGEICEPGEFCKLVGSCDPGNEPTEGVCTPFPSECPPYDEPVCSCQGISYPNECESDRAGESIYLRGPCPEVCGGVTGGFCEDPGDFCYHSRDGCCCDFQGVCEPPPTACPDTCRPVCGCDDVTYLNRCEAAMVPDNVTFVGECQEVVTVRFDSPVFMHWGDWTTPGSTGYHVYRSVRTADPPSDAGLCYRPGLPETSATILDDPPPGELWLFQVSAAFVDGEGPLGVSTPDCASRIPANRCGS